MSHCSAVSLAALSSHTLTNVTECPSLLGKIETHLHSNCVPPIRAHWPTTVFKLSFVIFSIIFSLTCHSASCSCLLLSEPSADTPVNQYAQLYLSSVNYNFSPRMLRGLMTWHGGKTPTLLPACDTLWILWCVIGAAYGYFPWAFCWRM